MAAEPRCVFCKRTAKEEREKVGHTYSRDGVTVHQYCLYFAAGLYQRGEEREGIYGFLLQDIRKEANRAAKLTCRFCHKKGAATGCVVMSCRQMCHAPCGMENGFLLQHMDRFEALCPLHRPFQSPQLVAAALQRNHCTVCFSGISNNPLDPFKILVCPACETGFHRRCLQHQAWLAGVAYFKCPVCSAKERFVQEMLKLGLEIPEYDTGNGNEEPCKAEHCLCPDGRSFYTSVSKYRLKKCQRCGKSLGHMVCIKGPLCLGCKPQTPPLSSSSTHFNPLTPNTSTKANFNPLTPNCSTKAHFNPLTPNCSTKAHFNPLTPNSSTKAQFNPLTSNTKAHFNPLTPNSSTKAHFNLLTSNAKAHFNPLTPNSSTKGTVGMANSAVAQSSKCDCMICDAKTAIGQSTTAGRGLPLSLPTSTSLSLPLSTSPVSYTNTSALPTLTPSQPTPPHPTPRLTPATSVSNSSRISTSVKDHAISSVTALSPSDSAKSVAESRSNAMAVKTHSFSSMSVQTPSLSHSITACPLSHSVPTPSHSHSPKPSLSHPGNTKALSPLPAQVTPGVSSLIVEPPRAYLSLPGSTKSLCPLPAQVTPGIRSMIVEPAVPLSSLTQPTTQHPITQISLPQEGETNHDPLAALLLHSQLLCSHLYAAAAGLTRQPLHHPLGLLRYPYNMPHLFTHSPYHTHTSHSFTPLQPRFNPVTTRTVAPPTCYSHSTPHSDPPHTSSHPHQPPSLVKMVPKATTVTGVTNANVCSYFDYVDVPFDALLPKTTGAGKTAGEMKLSANRTSINGTSEDGMAVLKIAEPHKREFERCTVPTIPHCKQEREEKGELLSFPKDLVHMGLKRRALDREHEGYRELFGSKRRRIAPNPTSSRLATKEHVVFDQPRENFTDVSLGPQSSEERLRVKRNDQLTKDFLQSRGLVTRQPVLKLHRVNHL